MAAGGVIEGDRPKTVLLRKRGSSLRQFGINESVRDPKLALYGVGGQLSAASDDWFNEDTNGLIRDAMISVGAASSSGSGSLEAALLISLPPEGGVG